MLDTKSYRSKRCGIHAPNHAAAFAEMLQLASSPDDRYTLK